jgi:hypothetical protein
MSSADDRPVAACPADVCIECQGGTAAPDPDQGSGSRAVAVPEAECPKCQGDRLVEWDAVLRAFVCGVCSHQWRPRLVVAARDRPAPGVLASE